MGRIGYYLFIHCSQDGAVNLDSCVLHCNTGNASATCVSTTVMKVMCCINNVIKIHSCIHVTDSVIIALKIFVMVAFVFL